MPSDARLEAALVALRPQRNAFRSALVSALGEIGVLLAPATAGAAAGRAAQELGGFAAGRIDADRFAALFAAGPTLDAAAVHVLERASRQLRSMLDSGDALFTLELQNGESLADAADLALAEAGRAFAAARAAELARTGRFHAAEHHDLFGPLPFRLWSRGERKLAPPLVILLDGADLFAAGLAAFLDGAQKIVLLVRGATPPAALARLITPGVFVAQLEDTAGLERIGGLAGPGIVACVDGEAALFVHDPEAGTALHQRLRVERLPDAKRAALTARPGVRAASAFQRADELALLHEWSALAAASGEAVGAAEAGAPPAQDAAVPPADRLAAWLLRQADLPASA